MGAPIEGCRPGVHGADRQIMVAWGLMMNQEPRELVVLVFGSSAWVETVSGDN